ncbi:SIS domain-containing protein [bacterium]|nr:SIS domain-containing protein [bacterium]
MDDTRFVREIRMQPDALRKAADFYSSREGYSLLTAVAETARSKRKIVFTGMGTSLYAPYLLVRELAGIVPDIEIHDAGELIHFGLDCFHGDELLVAVSQSGESAETKQAVGALKGRISTVSIVNNTASFMGMNSDFVLPLQAGDEASISTKTYTNTLAVLLLLAESILSKEPGKVIRGIRETADIMENTLEATSELAQSAVSFFGGFDSLHLIARGSDLVTARQWALTLKEGAGIFTEALSAGLFRHGPIEMAGNGHYAVCIASRVNQWELTVNLAKDLAQYGSRVLLITDEEKPDVECSNMLPVSIKCPDPRFFSMLCAPLSGLFIHETAKRRGREAGIFRHIQKITARE